MAGIQITLNNNTYSLHESRIVRMINSDNKSDATYMGWWDKFKDFFRSEKKSEMLSTLYDLLHSENSSVAAEDAPSDLYLGDITIFKKLASCSKEAYANLFTTSFDQNQNTISFHIGNSTLKTASIVDVLKSIKINGKVFIDDYSSILRAHRGLNDGKSSSLKIEGADDLRKISKPFYDDYPELLNFLNNSGIVTQNSVFDRVYDLLGDEIHGCVDDDIQDKLIRRQFNLATIYNHCSSTVNYGADHPVPAGGAETPVATPVREAADGGVLAG